MAVQKTRKSPSKRGMRRAHQHMTVPTLSQDKETGEVHLRHHLTKTGYYRGRRVVTPSEKSFSSEGTE